MFSKPTFLGIALALTASILTVSPWAPPLSAFEVFVSPQGDDSWTGTLDQPNAQKTDGPVASLTAARQRVRDHRRKSKDATEAIVITLRAGTYRLSETFQLGQVDSGTDGSPLIVRAYAGERPLVTGAAEVTGFKQVSPNIYSAALPEAIKDPHELRLVLSEGRRLPMARWPNTDPKRPVGGGWSYVDGRRPESPNDKLAGETEANRSKFKLRKSDLRKWQRPTDGELFIFTRFNYWNDLVPLSKFDPVTGQVELAKPCTYEIRPGDRYFVQGMREELDAQGEWYIDKDKRELLIYSDADASRLSVDAAYVPTLIATRSDAHHIRLEGLTLQGATGPAINVSGADHCDIVRCTIEHTGDMTGHGVALQSGEQNRVIDCVIQDIGASGVFTSGGDYKTLKAAGHVVQNNHIHHTGIINAHSGGVWLSGVGNSALNNDIHDCPRTGVMIPFGGENQLNSVEYNHIWRVNQQTQDSGAVYASGRDWLSGRGHKIRYNFIHDSLGYGWDGEKWVTPYYAWGIYLDDACSSCDVVGNIIVRCSRAGIMIHSGNHNLIENNIIVGGGEQQIEMRGWAARTARWDSVLEKMQQGYAEVKDVAAWKAIRGFGPPQEVASRDGKVMTDNVIQRNIMAYKGGEVRYMSITNLPTDRCTCDNNLIFANNQPPAVLRDDRVMVTWKMWQATGLDAHSQQANPKFKEASKDDYRLSDDSPALRMGFQPISTEKIGRQKQ